MSPEFCPEHGGICQEIGEVKADVKNIKGTVDEIKTGVDQISTGLGKDRTDKKVEDVARKNWLENRLGKVVLWALTIAGGVTIIDLARYILTHHGGITP